MKLRRAALILALGLAVVTPVTAQTTRPSQESNGIPSRSARAQTTGRIIVKWRRESARAMSASARVQKATAVSGLKLQRASPAEDEHEVLAADALATPGDIERAVANLERDPSVEYAAIEYRRKAHKLTTDLLLPEQWYLLSEQPAATRTEGAWDTTEGNPSVVVAVLDTGVRPDHPDLVGKLLPGRDFISNPVVANDGDGRDNDPSDPGDWVTPTEVQQSPNDFLDADCLADDGSQVNSSWHGTRVAGLIGAQTNNAAGVAGNGWHTQILPLRVLGKCGGNDVDIMDAMRWAAGIAVNGVTNPTPAQVINLSLGGEGPCTSAYQFVVNEITALGVLIIASAGNEGTQVSAPANCTGVLGVAGLRHIGTKVGFSNLGPQVGIAAPGGNCVNAGGACLFSIVVATNTGTTMPGTHTYTDQLNFNVGTSFSAPMAASAAALLRAVNSTLTPAQSILLLKASATTFPVNPSVATCTVPTTVSAPQDQECNCTISTCGAGMLNTGAAVAAALRPLAVLQTSGTVASGATLSIDGASSFASQGRTIAAHQWSVLDVTGATPVIANTSATSTTLQIPGESQFTLRLTVTDDQGTQDTREKTLATGTQSPGPTPTPPPAPAPSPGISNRGAGGGGGHLGWELLALAWLGVTRRRRRDARASRA